MMMMRVTVVATAPGLMKYLSAALSSVWVSPGLISTKGTVSLLRYSALTFARTTEHATGIICRIIFYTTQLKGDRSRGEEVEGTEGRRENEQESLAWHSLVTLHCVLNFCRGLCV